MLFLDNNYMNNYNKGMCGSCCLCFQACETANALNDSGFLYCLLRYTSRVDSTIAYSGIHLGQVPRLPTQVHIQGRFLYCLLRYTSTVGSSIAYSGTYLGQVPLQTSQVHIQGRFLYRLLRYISRVGSSRFFIVNTIKVIFKSKLLNWKLSVCKI